MSDEIAQLSLFSDAPSVTSPPHQVIYIPPTLQEIDLYAHLVCRELAERGIAPNPDTDTLRGFAAFIRAVVTATTNHRNRMGNGRRETTRKDQKNYPKR